MPNLALPIFIRAVAIAAAAALSITVVTQVLYIGLNASGTPLAINLWRIEAVAFLAIAVAGAALLHARPLVGAGLAIGGLLNVIQAEAGLVMFGPLTAAGEAMAPAFQAVLAGAFFCYFAGKAAFGFAALAAGLGLWGGISGAARLVGALAALTGLIALATNLLAMITGMDLLLPAGVTGTIAAVFLALALVMAQRPDRGP